MDSNTSWLNRLFSTEAYKQGILLLKNGDDITWYILKRMAFWIIAITLIRLCFNFYNTPLSILSKWYCNCI